MVEPNVLNITLDAINVIGDIHGQYFDCLEMFEVVSNEWCVRTLSKTYPLQKDGFRFESTNYLFLGDLVDRGGCSIDVLMLVLALKVASIIIPSLLLFLTSGSFKLYRIMLSISSNLSNAIELPQINIYYKLFEHNSVKPRFITAIPNYAQNNLYHILI